MKDVRTTFDRLIGPCATVMRQPDPRVITDGDVPYAVIVPVRFEAWRVVTGRGPTADLRREVAERANADDSELATAASRFGLRGHAVVVDPEGARDLMRSIQRKLLVRKNPPLRDPLVYYPEGHDPRQWAKLSAVETLDEDRADWIAHGLEWCLWVLSQRPDAAECDRRARVAARRWVVSDGIGRLQRLVLAQLSTKPAIARGEWPAVLANALLQRSASVKDARVLWHGLAVIAPLLLAMAETLPAPSDGDRRPRLDLVLERVQNWRDLAREASAWLEFVDALAMLEEELSESMNAREADEELTAEIRDKLEALCLVLRAGDPIFDPRQSFDHLEASDTDGIWVALREVMTKRLEVAGVSALTPGGAPVTAEAAVLLSVRKSFDGGSCGICGAKTKGRKQRCKVHERDRWREQKRRLRSSERGCRTSRPRRVP